MSSKTLNMHIPLTIPLLRYYLSLFAVPVAVDSAHAIAVAGAVAMLGFVVVSIERNEWDTASIWLIIYYEKTTP